MSFPQLLPLTFRGAPSSQVSRESAAAAGQASCHGDPVLLAVRKAQGASSHCTMRECVCSLSLFLSLSVLRGFYETALSFDQFSFCTHSTPLTSLPVSQGLWTVPGNLLEQLRGKKGEDSEPICFPPLQCLIFYNLEESPRAGGEGASWSSWRGSKPFLWVQEQG